MTLNQILSPIHDDLEKVEVRLREALRSEFAPLENIFESLIESGGKRIRPALVILATKFHPADEEQTLTLAVVTELVHAATLIHDDLIDKSPLRRGSPTVNARWSGTATVLAGDYLLARAADIAASLENFRIMKIFARTLMTICEGEIRQDFGGTRWPPNQAEYYRHIDCKTASLFNGCTEGGAVLSHAPEAEIDALKTYGHNLGLAFQIADDILDFIASERELGKPVGSDLRQGTFTLPVLYFIEQDTRAKKLEEIFRNDGKESQEMDGLIDVIRQSPAIESSKTQARQFAHQAQAALAILPDNQYRRALFDLATYVVERTA